MIVVILIGIILINSVYGLIEKQEVEIEQEVLEKLKHQTEVFVIVTLKEPSYFDKTYIDLDTKKQIYKEIQSEVLSKLTINNFKLKNKYSLSPGFSGYLTIDGLEKLKRDYNVKEIHISKKGRYLLDSTVPLINADDVVNIGLSGQGKTTCVIDSGIDFSHPDFGDCNEAKFNAGNCNKIIDGFDFINNDATPEDVVGHGTFVASVATGNGSIIKGVAPDSKLVILRNGINIPDEDATQMGVEWCFNNRTKFDISVITISSGLGSNSNDPDCSPTKPLSIAINNVYDSGLTVITASGNDGDITGITYPSCIRGAISVGATNDNDEVASFTNRDEILDLMAPGFDICAARGNSTGFGSPTCIDTQHAISQGTSFAAPHVAGATTLMLQKNSALTPNDIKQILNNTGVPIEDSATGLTFMRIDVAAAIAALETINIGESKTATIRQRQKWQTQLNVNTLGKGFEVHLIENNPESSNLDLSLIKPDGTKITATEADGHEVILGSSPDGLWNITVFAESSSGEVQFTIETNAVQPPGTGSGGGGGGSPGGINFTDANLNYVSTCDIENVNFVMKAKEAEVGEPIINITNLTTLAADSFLVGLTIPNHNQWITMDIIPGSSPTCIPGNEGDVSRVDEDLAHTIVAEVLWEADILLKQEEFGVITSDWEKDILDDWRINVTSSSFFNELNDAQFDEYPIKRQRAFIKPDFIEADSSGCNIFLNEFNLTVEYVWDWHHLGDLSKYRLRQEVLDDLQQRLDSWANRSIESHKRNITSLHIERINNDEDYAELRTVFTGLTLAQWYKTQDLSNSPFGDLINTRNITDLDIGFDESFWDSQACQFLYSRENPKNFRQTEEWTWNYYGGIALSQSEPKIAENVSNQTESLMNEALTKAFVHENETFFFSTNVRPNKPDLDALALGFTSSTPAADEIINITAFIRNRGIKDAKDVRIFFYDFYTYPNNYTAQYPIGETNISLISVNEFKLIKIKFNSSLLGTHNITAEVDFQNDIEETSEVNNLVSKNINILNPFPTAVIIGPVGGLQFFIFETIRLEGEGNDLQDGALTDTSLRWESNIDGLLGFGNILDANLSLGNHIISLTVNDSTSRTDTKQASIAILSSQKPEVMILSPLDDEKFAQGENIYFEGKAIDAEDGILAENSLNWNSSIGGNLDSGTSFVSKDLSIGTQTITLTATDSSGTKNEASIGIEVEFGQPSLTITTPSNEQVFFHKDIIEFSGTATDPQDGTISKDIVWKSNIDGEIGSDESFSRNLSIGDHLITATIIDSHGLTSRESINITISEPIPPTASIIKPANNKIFTNGELIIFNKEASDAEDIIIPNSSILWNSSLDGFIGDGSLTSLNTTSLSLGLHEITLEVRDSDNLATSTEVNITIESRTPELNLILPISGTVISEGNFVNFSGIANDLEDGILANSSLEWNSSKDGFLGIGSLMALNNLSTGLHILTLKATDSDNKITTKTVTVTVSGLGQNILNVLSDGSLEQEIAFNQDENKTIFLKLPKDADVTDISFALKGLQKGISGNGTICPLDPGLSWDLFENFSTEQLFAQWENGTNYFNIDSDKFSWNQTVNNADDGYAYRASLFLGSDSAMAKNFTLVNATTFRLEISTLLNVPNRGITAFLSFNSSRDGSGKGFGYAFRMYNRDTGSVEIFMNEGGITDNVLVSIDDLNRINDLHTNWTFVKNQDNGFEVYKNGIIYNAYTINISDPTYSSFTGISLMGNGIGPGHYVDYVMFTDGVDCPIPSFPTNPTLDTGIFDNGFEWSVSGEFNAEENITNATIADEINNFLDTCTEDLSGRCLVPLRFHSETSGIIKISDINIDYTISDTRPPNIFSFDVTPNPAEPNVNLEITANVSDNINITGVAASLLNAQIELTLNETSNLYEGSLTSPSISGDYILNLTAIDNSNLTNISSVLLKVRANNPELAVFSNEIITIPKTPDENQSTIINATIHNFGNTDANSFTVEFLIDNITKDTTLLSVLANNNDSVGFAWLSLVGSHTITIKADSTDIINETNETNNNADKLISVTDITPPLINEIIIQDLIFESASLIIKANVTDNVDVNIVTANINGNEFQLLFNSTSNLFEGSALAPSSDDYTLKVKAIDVNSLVSIKQQPVTILSALADLALSNKDVEFIPALLSDGINNIVRVKVKNNGNTDAERFTIEFLVDNIQEDNATLDVLAGSANTTFFSFIPEFNSNLITIRLDPLNNITESDETNNEFNITVDVIDLTLPSINSIEINEPIYETKTLEIKVNATDNVGISNVNATIGSTLLVLSFNPISGLFENSTTAPSAGIHSINITVEDTSGSKSIRRTKVIVNDIEADLTLDSSDVLLLPQNITEPELLTINVTIHNNGGTNADNFNAKFEVDGFIQNNNVSVEKASTNITQFIWNSSFGNFTITITLDPNNIILESNESNNIFSREIFALDITPPPKLNVTATPDNWTNSSIHIISWDNVSDKNGVDHYEYQIDFGEFTSVGLNTSFNTTPQQEGLHTVFVRAVDIPGNIGEAGSVDIFIDKTPPNTPFLREWLLGADWINKNQAFYRWTDPGDDGSGIRFYTILEDNLTEINMTAVSFRKNWTSGNHTLRVKAIDAVGQESNFSNQVNVLVDLQVPLSPNVTSSTHPIETEFFNNKNILLEWTKPSDLSGIERYYYLITSRNDSIPDRLSSVTGNTTLNITEQSGGQGFNVSSNATNPIISNLLGDGTWYFHIISEDRAGNLGINVTHFRFNIDATAPALFNFTPGNNSNITDNTPLILVNYEDIFSEINISSVRLKLDGIEVTPDVVNETAVLFESANLSIGLHNASVMVADKLGNLASDTWFFNIVIVEEPPELGLIECNDGAGFTDCSNIQYNVTLTEVRAVCTDVNSNIVDVVFELNNIQDNSTFFNLASTSNNGTTWIFDNSDILIQDSGDFNLTVTCSDTFETVTNSTSWFVPFGILEPFIIPEDINVTKNELFNFSSGVRCVGGECGDVEGILDPFIHRLK